MDIQEKILISVIIPSYNRADTVGETIESLVAQEGIGTEYDLEIVIGDDCSTDNAREVLEQYRQKYPNFIRLFLREQNVGLGANWAMCVKDCRGKYICNCDNDDYWHNPQKLHLQLEYMESHPESNVCLTNYRTHNRGTGDIQEYETWIDRSKPLQMAMWSSFRVCNATFMYRANFLKKHIDLDTFISHQFYLQDWPAWVILAGFTDFDILPVSTATFGVETASITRPRSYEGYRRRLEKEEDVGLYLRELFPNVNFPGGGGNDVEVYINTRLMALAYHNHDYPSAKQYGKLAEPSFKQICSQNRLLFTLWCLLKR